MKTQPKLLAIRSGRWDREKKFVPGYLLLLQHPYLLAGFAMCRFQTDGSDATDRIIETIQEQQFPVNYILLKGITIAGLNFIDPFRLNQVLEIPILVITTYRKGGLVEAANKHSSNANQIRTILTKLRSPVSVETRFGTIGLQCVGEDLQVAKNLVYKSALVSKLPEPLRILKIILKGLEFHK